VDARLSNGAMKLNSKVVVVVVVWHTLLLSFSYFITIPTYLIYSLNLTIIKSAGFSRRPLQDNLKELRIFFTLKNIIVKPRTLDFSKGQHSPSTLISLSLNPPFNFLSTHFLICTCTFSKTL